MTSVGGPQLHLNAQGDATLPDNVWNESYLFGEPAAGGGGPSAVFARPTYQNGVKGVVGLHRGTPDISLSAAVDGGALVYMSFGGLPGPGSISSGAPVRPRRSSPASSPSPTRRPATTSGCSTRAVRHRLRWSRPPDITTGNNTVTFNQNGHNYTVPGFNAVSGYDMASGLGTVDGAQLVAALAGK